MISKVRKTVNHSGGVVGGRWLDVVDVGGRGVDGGVDGGGGAGRATAERSESAVSGSYP